MKPLRVGLIGIGNVGQVHLDVYRDLDGVEVVAAADLRPEARAAATARGAKAYEDHLHLLEKEDLDLACILTPAASHEAVALACAEAGVHALCEKPLTLTLLSAERMMDAFRRRSLHLFYGACYRFLPAVRRARELIAEGAIGEVVLMREQIVTGQGQAAVSPLGAAHYPEGGPGGTPMGLVDHGIHLIDTFRWLLGEEIVSVYGRGNISGEAPATEYMVMTFESGAIGQLIYDEGTYATDLPSEGSFSWGAGWDASGAYAPPGRWQAQPGTIHIHGTKGALRIFHYGNALFLFEPEGARQIPLLDKPAPMHFAAQMESVTVTLRENHPASVDAAEGFAALRALLGVYESQQSGARVDLTSVGSTTVGKRKQFSARESV